MLHIGGCVRAMGNMCVVAEQGVEDFVKAKRLEGVAEKTPRDYVYTFREMLVELDWALTPEGVREYLAGLNEEGEEHVPHHLVATLM